MHRFKSLEKNIYRQSVTSTHGYFSILLHSERVTRTSLRALNNFFFFSSPHTIHDFCRCCCCCCSKSVVFKKMEFHGIPFLHRVSQQPPRRHHHHHRNHNSKEIVWSVYACKNIINISIHIYWGEKTLLGPVEMWWWGKSLKFDALTF